MIIHKGLSVFNFPNQAAWDEWLFEQSASSPGAWLKFAKKSSGQTTLSKAEAIETALAHGWVDGQLNKFDDQFWLVRFTRRGPRSRWSEVNRDTATRLLAEGRMTPAGHTAVEAAQRDGRWEAAYAPQSRAEVPNDLHVALAAEPQAAAFFATLTGANRYAVIYRVNEARTAKTRAERIDKFVAMLGRCEILHPANRRKIDVEWADREEKRQAMTVFVALLRAVNVGGTGKLAMRDLTHLCESAGFQHVRTYIASGNVVFESDLTEAEVKAALEGRLLTHVGKPVGVVVRTGAEMAAVTAANPFPDAAPARTIAIFLDTPPAPHTLDTITGRQGEELRLGAREIYVHYNQGMAVSKLRLPAASGGTARNMNTVAKLASMAGPSKGA